MLEDWLTDIDGDDEEATCVPNFGDNFSGGAVKGATLDDELRFTGLAVTLALNDLAGEDNAFEVKDTELVIF